MEKQVLSTQGKIAIALGVVASLRFLIAALVVFLQTGDWPAKYVSAGVSILAVMFIAIRRRALCTRP
ncbi:MAG: hypothetical protein ABR501_04515 [Pyrinomonadaceae bacterium]